MFVTFFFLRCWQGPLLAPSRKTWELHFFPVDKPVSYPFHTCFILKKHKYIYTHSTLNMSFTHSRINASHVFNLYIYNSVRLLWLKSSARNHRNYLINELNLIERVFFHHALLHTIFVFITSILKSLVIPAILLALSSVIYLRMALFLL